MDPECGPTVVEAAYHDDSALRGGKVGVREYGKSCTEGKEHAAKDGDATEPCPNAQMEVPLEPYRSPSTQGVDRL